MTVTDLVITAVLVVIVGAAIGYMVKAKKSGAKCIGCPYSKSCPSHRKSSSKGCSCGCGGEKQD